GVLKWTYRGRSGVIIPSRGIRSSWPLSKSISSSARFKPRLVGRNEMLVESTPFIEVIVLFNRYELLSLPTIVIEVTLLVVSAMQPAMENISVCVRGTSHNRKVSVVKSDCGDATITFLDDCATLSPPLLIVLHTFPSLSDAKTMLLLTATICLVSKVSEGPPIDFHNPPLSSDRRTPCSSV